MSLTAVVANDADDTIASANNENLTVQTSTDDGAVIEQSNQEIMNTEQGSESDQGDVLSASSDEDVLGETFYQLHRDINDQIYSGYVYLDKDYTSTYSYSSYSIYQDVVIDGQGHTIDCGGYNRVFQISRSGYQSPINLTFKNINFVNGYNSGNGGIIYGSFNSNCQDNSLTIINCTFDNCQAKSGGAIYLSSMIGNVSIQNCSFTNNVASEQAGAIDFYNQYQFGLNTVINNTVFKNNRATEGGALYTYRDAKLWLYSCNITDNYASKEGGFIRYSSDLYFNDCKVYNNTCSFDGGVAYAGQPVTFTAERTDFIDNKADRWGGVVSGRSLVVDNCLFKNNVVNTTKYSGSPKTSSARGGALFSREGTSYITFSTFIDNLAQEGSAICMEERAASVTVGSCNFINNVATLKGGAVYSDANTMTAISGSKFENNKANYGGAVYCGYVSNMGKVSISACEFRNNNASIEGGAIYIAVSGAEVVNSIFTSNRAPIGGAIYWNGDNGKVQGSNFINNEANNGSSICWRANSGSVVTDTFSDSNPATGSVYWHGNNGLISGSTFSGVKAIYICSHAVNVNLKSNTQHAVNLNDYSVYNGGTAEFESNNFVNPIYNYGLITSPTYLVTLNNNTIITNVTGIPVFTRIEDDNKNTIKINNTITLVYDSNERLTTTFNNTHYVSTLSNLLIGLHNFTATGYSTSNFQDLTVKNGAILYLVMNLTVNQTNYGEKVVFTVTLVNTTLNGTIILTINDASHNLPLINGVANLTQYNMAPNKYHVVASYVEYNQTLRSDLDIEVNLRNSTLNVVANNITHGGIVSINVTTTNGTTGDVGIFVNNKMYTVTLMNSTAQLNLTNLAGGSYTVFAVYFGDAHFNGCNNNTEFTVAKQNLTINITANDVSMGQTAVIVVNMPNDANGTTYVYVDSTIYEFNRQPIAIDVVNLTAGTHSVRVIYGGNDKYLSNTNSTTFEVNKLVINPTIIAPDIYVGDNATITVNLIGASNATGLVLLTVNNIKYYAYANNTYATFTISGLPQGKYNVTATYLEDDIHYAATTNSSFKVDYVVIDPAISYGQDDDLNVLLNVTVPADVNGDIVIEVNGTNYTAPVVKGKFSVPINGLEGGVYPAVMYFANDTKYHSVTKQFNITLNKIPTRIHIISEHIEVGDNATITVVVPTDAKGNVTIKINNENYTENVINGSAVFTVQGLTFGNYTIDAVYSGDRKYQSDEEDEVLIVRKVDPNPDSYINVTDIFVGEIATFNITMPSDLTAKINLTVQNKTYVVNITNGFGQINISGLKYGLPVPVHASFLGNDKYLGCERDYTAFSVHRITNYPMNITAVTDSSTANITVNIPSDANGTGYFTIDNRTFTIKYTNGKSNMTTVTDLIAGQEYVVYAYFDGNEKYTAGDVSRTLNSNKTLNYTFQVSGTDILVGQTAYITIYLPNITNGTVTIKVPGMDVFTVDINETFVNGTYDYPVYNLAAGSYLCSVTYNGNDMYEASSRYGTIVVSKINTSPRINFNTTYVGQNLTIQVTLPSDANGTVNITINNTRYSANVTNGTAYVIVPAGLRATTYSATLFYSGNEKYNNRTQTFLVTILRVSDYLFNVTPIDIYVGDNETITITLPADIDVNVTVSIPGTDYINKVHKLINGTVTFNVTGLAAGRYNVTASISGSSKYVDSSITRAFTVSTIGDYLFNLHDVATVYVRDNLTFILDLPDDAKGNVTVHIFDEDFIGEVKNGTATITVPTTAQGNYLFTISFEQEGKYNYKSQEGYAFVIKKDVELNPIYDSSVNVDENITITFVLPEDATGNVSVTSRGVTFTAELVNGTANVTLLGYPLSSTYSPSISYTGDDKYNPASGFIVITTHKVSDYNITVEVANITVDDVESVNITVPSDATEDVLVSGNFSNNTFSVKLTNGTATLDIPDLPAGTYYINVRYQGYQKYADKNVTKIFRVDKVVPPISIEFTNNDTLTVKLPSLANGIANITIGDNPTVQIDIVNGVGSLNVSYLRPGSYFVNATFLGGVRYLENSTNITIIIPKIEDYVLPIKVDDITVYENATIVVIVPEYATGNVNITIDGGDVIEVPIINGTATYDADGLKVGNHTVIATYEGDEYVFKTNSTNFTVSKVNTVLKDDVKYNATSLTVNMTLTETVTGNVTITIDGKPYNYYNIDSNKINLTVPTIPGTHIIAINYSGDENHTVASDFMTIEISKIKDYNLTVNATPVITVIDNNVVTVTISKGIEGEITLYINGEEYDEYAIINSTTGKATLTLDRLPSGNYTLVAVFSSNVYDRVENSTTFEVIKLNTTISVNVTNITKDLTEVINVTLNENATGYVEIFVNNVTFRVPVVNGTAVLTRSNLVDKTYPIVVRYLGDDYYNANETTAEFTVSKIPVNITITCNDIVIGQEANFTIVTSRNITDQVTVRIDNKNYTAVVYNGKGNLIVLGQNVGNHNVTVFYAGDKDYLPANDTINVTVHDRLPTSISVNVTNITVGENVTIYINVTGAENGTVRIYMLGNPVNVTITNGTGNYTYVGLTARDYHFTAEYLENTYYKSSTTTGDFTVFKKKSYVTVEVDNINVGDVALINITISENTTGHVLVSFSNIHLYADINGTSFISLPVADLPVGEYNVTVTYNGDANFYNSTNKTQFNISKLTTTINISCNSTIVEKHPVVFNITTSANFTQVVIIRVNGTNYDENFTSFVENGKGTFTLYDLGGGNYTATVLFPGNGQYYEARNSTNFTVLGKKATKLNVTVNNITLGENATVMVTVTGAQTGQVTLNIAGRPQTKDVVDGKVNFTVTDLSARDYHVTVTYIENDEFLSSNATADFTVYRKNSTVTVNVSNIKVGEDAIFNITVSDNATGHVLISFANMQLYAVINGSTTFSVRVADLPVAEYNVTVTYVGDSNYYNSTNKTQFNITKLTTSINITCDEIIIDGQPVVFTVATSANITEVVYIIVNGTNHTTFIKEGKGTFTVYGLASGNYTAVVEFVGNSKYDYVTNETKFNVTAKLPSAITINVTDVVLGDNVTIKVNVTNGTTGRVALSIYGQIITRDLVNSSATFVVSNLPAREFPFTVTYLGDDNYFPSDATAHVTVHKLAAPLSANVTNSTVGSVEYINVTAPANATGNILISINGTNYYSKIEKGVARFNITGLSEGNYTAYITYRGDDNFNASAMQTNLTITKLTTTITISTNSTIVIGHPVEFTITTSANMTEVVYVEVNGTNHTTFVKEGKGTFTVYGLEAANYTAKVYFSGNTQYNAVDNSTKFNVTGKSPVSIAVSVNNITLGENAMVFVTVNATSGSVTLNIAGRPQTKAVDANGKVNFIVTDLIARDYFVTATYLGTDEYLSNVTNTTFTVFKKKSELSINVTNIFVGDNETIKINVTKGATGVVLIDIAGVQVYARLNNATSIAIALFDDLGIGTYNVTATYMGDNNYNGSSNNASFNVTKLETSIIITGSNITVGQVETFNITTSANLTEVITIEVDGVNYTTFIQNGKGTYTYYGLEEGTHTVYVYFAGNSKYDAEQNSTVVKVTGQKPSAVTVNVTSITVGENATIYVNVTEGATGYVMITIAGESHVVELNNSKANITIENLTARHYHVTAYYLGDDYYLGSENTTEFDVNKKATLINVTAVDITVDKNEIITIKITNGTTGVVLIDINGTDYYANIVNGTAKLVVNNFAVGEYNVTVEYEGDANYAASVNSTRFNVTKLNSDIDLIIVTLSPVAEGSAITINVTGPADATGIAIVSVKDNDLNTVQNYTVYINNGQGSLVLLDQPVGHYSVVANYQENYKYLANVSNTGAFEVYATGSNLNVKAENIYVGDNETIIVTVAGEYDENVTIKIGNLTYESPLVYNSTSNNSVATFKLDYKFPAGTYTVQASFISEDAGRIVTHEGRDSFIVSKINSTVGINSISDIKVSENVTVTFTLAPSDATGTIDVYVNGERHIVNADNLTLTLTGLAAGHYFVQAMYGGDNKYLPSSANATFEVYKNNISITLDVVSIRVNETEYINVTLESDARGYVLININGTQYYAQIKEGKASVNVTGLEIGEYTVNATFIGDDKYYSNSTVVKFTVTKLATTIEITGYDIYEGQDVVFTITTSANITEVVKIEVAGKNYTAFVENGKGNYTVSGLKVGNYNVTAYFPGNTKYDAVNDTINITVKGKTKTSINVTVEDITVGDEITVVINATKGINDTVYVTIAGVAYTHTLVDGQGSFKVPNLIARDYVVSVFFMGNTEFELCNNTSNFTVHKKDTSIKLNVTDIYVDETEMIKVEVNKNATGNVLITIGEVRVYANLTDGVAIVNITGLAVGEYNVTVVYVGDAIYNANSTNATFNVTKRSIGINITCDDEYVIGQPIVFTIKTSVNITEVVTITIGENVYHTFVENGTGTYTVTGLTPDDYTALVNFTGNFYYDPVGNFTTFKVIDKLPSSLTVNVTNITVGQNLVVKVNVTQGATGNITLVIAGNTYTEKINGNVAEFTIENLTARNYHITAYYFGDTYYYGSNATADFVVNKLNTTISAKVTNSTVGSVEYINVTLDAQNGTVLLSVNGSHYYADVINGVAKFNVTGLKEGVYTAEITYLENDYYNSNATSVSIKITKLSTTISIVTVNITEGQVAVFNITTSANMTQVVIVMIGENNYTTFVENGKGTLTVYDLAADKYTAVVTFPGNDQYGPASDSVDFTVSAKKASQINVTAKDITIGEDAIIEVSVAPGATGNVTIVILGREFTQAVDAGKATFTISKENLTARDYHVTAIYEGDTYYLTSNNATDFKVDKINTTISASVTNSTVGSVEYITVTVSAQNGTVLLNINGSHYYGEVIDGVAKFNVTGLLVGNYTAEIRYVENDIYNGNYTEAKFTISKKSTTIIIKGHDITEGQTETLTITTSANITALVKIEIDGVNYTTFISEGKGTFTISNLTSGLKTAKVYYLGDDEYFAIDNKTDFTVDHKRDSQVNITVEDITIGDDENIIINVTKGATGNVTIVISGTEYVRPIDDNGQVLFTKPASELMARDYSVTVIYGGNTYYKGSKNTANFTVSKKPSSVDLDVHNITVGDTEIIKVNVTSGATGMVLINVSGTYYYADLEDGKATFNVAGLKTGEYTAIVTYAGDDNYNRSVASKAFVVHPQITLEAGENNGTETPITVKVSDNATGNVTVVVNGTPYTAKVENGTATVYVKDAQPGEQNVTVTYDDGKNPITQNQTVDIPKVTGYDVNVTSPDVKVGENGTITVKLPEDATGNVTVKVGNQTIPAKVENGTAVVNVNDLPVGSYDVDVSYSGDDKYAGTNTKSHINVEVNIPTINAVEKLVRGWNSIYDYEAVFLDKFGNALEGVNVTFIINGKSYTVLTEKHGVAKLTTSHLDVGEYNVTSINPVTGETVTKGLKVVPRLIHNKDITMDFMDGSYYSVLVIGDDGNPVGEGEIIDIYVNTIHYVSKTNKDGVAKLKINLNPKKYKVMAEYKNYKVYNKLVVKQTLKLVKKTVSVKKGKKIVLKAKLKWTNGKAIKGKKIVFKFKGKKYKAKTNKKGIAKVTIKKKSVLKKLKKGKKYSFTASYHKNKVKGKVKIKK